MEVKMIVQEIERLPLRKRYSVIEKTLKSIRKEESNSFALLNDKKSTISDLLINEKSLEKDWLSEEDNRWDAVL